MKISREQGFKPILITIETEEEANTLWHIFNCSFSMSLREYERQNQGNYVVPVSEMFKELNDKMFKALDGVYDPVRGI